MFEDLSPKQISLKCLNCGGRGEVGSAKLMLVLFIILYLSCSQYKHVGEMPRKDDFYQIYRLFSFADLFTCIYLCNTDVSIHYVYLIRKGW